jgi:hypothetical protein
VVETALHRYAARDHYCSGDTCHSRRRLKPWGGRVADAGVVGSSSAGPLVFAWAATPASFASLATSRR